MALGHQDKAGAPRAAMPVTKRRKVIRIVGYSSTDMNQCSGRLTHFTPQPYCSSL